ncbi:RDD family protein [Chryseobacterium sp.]|uniref:RDD family protein n=1 Tax=Chryseobacterium sp. TaxID=1871047 RepID=UPI0011CC6200|nr:RDD family protein [Chryseobacterium sp.]TXF79237.1 RDD family protein [Chryseobacterium sp.]
MKTKINIAKFWTRIWALLIDSLLLGVIGYLMGLAVEDFLVSIGNYGLLFGLVITVVYQTIFNSRVGNGQTLGKRAMNIQVVDINGDPIDLGKSFLRALILCLPYFTVNLTIPGLSDTAIVNVIKTIILATIVIGVVVIYIFNKQTRQSLHDLAVGTYVASTYRKKEPTILPTMTKTPFYVFGGLVTLLIGVSVFAATWKAPELKDVLSIYSKVSNIDGVLNASVVENTNYTNGSKTLSYTANLWVQNLPQENLENNKVVREVVQTILNNANSIDRFDVISISMTREFNIGIASKKTSSTISHTPSEWRAILK